MKTLYILRHGIAVEPGARGATADSQRALTPQGRTKIRKIARELERLGVKFDLLVTSPLVRARQTAQIVATVFKARQRLEEDDMLAIGGQTETLVSHLGQRFRTAEAIMLVGHEPSLSELASVLVAGTPDVSLVLKKGGVCKLTLERLYYGRCARLEWLLPPRVLIG